MDCTPRVLVSFHHDGTAAVAWEQPSFRTFPAAGPTNRSTTAVVNDTANLATIMLCHSP